MGWHVDRRALIGGAGASLGLLLRPSWADAAGASPTECIARTVEGRLRGVRANGLDTYRGVPYAGSVAGAGRFRAAPPLLPWEGIRDATRLGAPSIQPPGGWYGIDEPSPDENCLFLNIWSPTGGPRGKPDMFYSHGGGFATGSGASTLADGSNLARENDVVVVATNHRLGALGFLYLDELGGEEFAGSGNRGIQDIATALAWVSRNIAAFGGDPHNVMIFGESGGGGKTSCLYSMPAAAPYFHKASIESGPIIRVASREVASETTRRMLAELGIERTSWRRLLEMPASQILAAQSKIGAPPNMVASWPGPVGLIPSVPGSFGPVVDGHLLPGNPFDPAAPAISRDKPLITGGNEDEHRFFALVVGDRAAWQLDEAQLKTRMATSFGSDAERLIATYRSTRPNATPSDVYFAIESSLFSHQGSTVMAERKARQGGAPVYRYIFAFDKEGAGDTSAQPVGSMHGLDIAFKFDNMDARIMGRPAPFVGTRPERFVVGRTMSRMWATFARTGRPAAPGAPAWPAYDLRRRATMYIDTACRVVDDPKRDERLFWSGRSY